MKFKLPDLRCVLTALVLCLGLCAAAQTTVKGTVIDSFDEPLIGVSVSEKGVTGSGATTDIDGNYSLTVKNPNATLVFSYVGMETQEIKLNGRTQLNVTMKESSVALQEVVAVGYGTARKVDITGSV